MESQGGSHLRTTPFGTFSSRAAPGGASVKTTTRSISGQVAKPEYGCQKCWAEPASRGGYPGVRSRILGFAAAGMW